MEFNLFLNTESSRLNTKKSLSVERFKHKRMNQSIVSLKNTRNLENLNNNKKDDEFLRLTRDKYSIISKEWNTMKKNSFLNSPNLLMNESNNNDICGLNESQII